MSEIKIQLKEYNDNEIIEISGSKNSSLPIIAASILCDEIVYINNIPNIRDVNSMLNILNYLKIKYFFQSNTLKIYPKKHIKNNLNTRLTQELRGSYYYIGALLSKKSKVKYSNIGGCKLGNRPINYHINAFKRMGFKTITKEKENIISGKIRSTVITLSQTSIGATINIILSSVKNKKGTNVIIKNASIEPEVIDLCNFLNSMGAKIKGIGNSTINIKSVKYLHTTNYTIISDRIEAGTYLILGALHSGIKLRNVNTKHLESLIKRLEEIGCTIKEDNGITILKSKKEKSISINTNPFPDFPTDLAPQISVLASQLNGFSTITENIYKERLSHINELKKLNIQIIQNMSTSYIQGKQNIIYNKKNLICKDLRQGAALILGASLSKETVTISNIDIIERGYENIYHKLKQLGFEIKYIRKKEV